MMDIIYGEETFTIKDDVNDINIGEFERISQCINNNEDFYDKWFGVLSILGLPEKVIDDLDANELIDLIKKINISEVNPEYIREIEIDGFRYVVDFKDDEPRITGKLFKNIEKVCKKDFYIADIMALLFKREDLGDIENWDISHINHKASLFRKEKASICLPYLKLITDKYIKNLDALSNGN